MKDTRDAPEARDARRFLLKWGLFWLLLLNIPVTILIIVAIDDNAEWVLHLVLLPILIILVLKIPARKAEDFIGEDDGEAPLVEDLRSGNIDGYTEAELAQMETCAAEWDARHGVAPEPAPEPEPQLSREALRERMDALDERLAGLTRSRD